MNSTDNNNPTRLKKIDEFVALMTANLTLWDEGDKSPEQTNLCLAMCELAMNLPPAWFSHQERTMIAVAAQTLYGDAFKFLNDIDSGEVSYFAKFCHRAQMPEGFTLDAYVSRLYEAHERQFGSII